jgi:hypothetical protein
MAMRGGPNISKGGSGLPSRLIFHGVEGIGKSTLGAFAPKPIFGMSRGETGLLTLIDNGLVPETDHFDEWQTWHEAMECINWLIVEKAENRTFVLDTLNGLERLCHEQVCKDAFDDRWDYFQAFGKGVELALQEWIRFLTLLDRLREVRRMGIILLCHTKVKTFKNPEGDDYDRYTPDLSDKTWSITHKWADIVLFGNYKTDVKKQKGDTKAKPQSAAGTSNRFFYTQRTPAYDAKNRNGLPHSIPMGAKPSEVWNGLLASLKRNRPVAGAPAAANGTHSPAVSAVTSPQGSDPAPKGGLCSDAQLKEINELATAIGWDFQEINEAAVEQVEGCQIVQDMTVLQADLFITYLKKLRDQALANNS